MTSPETFFWHRRHTRTTSNGNRRPWPSSTDPAPIRARYTSKAWMALSRCGKNWRSAQTLPTPQSEECCSFGNSALSVPLPDRRSMPTSPNCLTSPLSSLAPKKQSPTWSSRIISIRHSLQPMQSRSRSFNLVQESHCKKLWMHSMNARGIDR